MGLFRRATPVIDRGVEAEALRDRLAAVPWLRPCDRAAVEAALAEHLAALELPPRPVRWVEGVDADQAARAGFQEFWAACAHHGIPEAPGLTVTATRHALFGSGLIKHGLVGFALEAEKDVDRSVRRAARHAVFAVHSSVSRAAGDQLDVDLAGPSVGLARAMTAVCAALADLGIVEPSGPAPSPGGTRHTEAEWELETEVETASAAAQALEAANWLARAHVLREAGAVAEAHDRIVNAYRPLIDAVEAGLWLFWVTDDEVLAVATPDH